jgi:aryl-alcohol dehydrogenase-like predicted oxidoreductase
LARWFNLANAPAASQLPSNIGKAWEFSNALHLQKTNGWARFVSLQDTHNLLTREEEREMLPLCINEGVQTIVYSPLARGRLARSWGESTARSETEAAGHNDDSNAESDRRIVEAVGAVATEHGVSQASVALAWLRTKPVVAAPIFIADRLKTPIRKKPPGPTVDRTTSQRHCFRVRVFGIAVCPKTTLSSIES